MIQQKQSFQQNVGGTQTGSNQMVKFSGPSAISSRIQMRQPENNSPKQSPGIENLNLPNRIRLQILKYLDSIQLSPKNQDELKVLLSPQQQPRFSKLVIATSNVQFFINKLKMNSYVRKVLNEYQLQLIDDLHVSKAIEVKIMDFHHPFAIAFQVIFIMFIILSFLWFPFSFSFLANEGKEYNQFIGIIIIIIEMADILLSFNISYIQKGKNITNRYQIARNYLRTKAALDLVIILIVQVSLSVIFMMAYLPLNKGFFIIIVLVLHLIFNTIKIQGKQFIVLDYLNLHGHFQDIFGLIKLFLSVLMIGHLFACLWHGVAYYQTDHEKTWLGQKQIIYQSNFTKYNYSFYWATMTMVTVGYGDIIPQNNSEVFFASVTMFLACGVFGYSINSIGSILDNLNSRFSEFKRFQAALNRYFTNKQVNYLLQQRIKSYFDYMWKEEQEQNDLISVEKLPSALQDELQWDLCRKNLEECSLLKQFGEKILKRISRDMEIISYSPEVDILTQDTLDDCALYLIVKGAVEVKFIGGREKVISQLKKGQFFGEQSFFSGFQRQASVVSKDFTQMYKITRSNFLKILSNHPKEFELYHQIKDTIIFNQSQQLTKLKCFSCKKNSHLIKQCPLIHYQTSKEKVIKREQFPFMQQRQERHERKSKVPFHSWRKISDTQSQANRIQTTKKLTLIKFQSNESILDDEELDSPIDLNQSQKHQEFVKKNKNTSNSIDCDKQIEQPERLQSNDKSDKYISEQQDYAYISENLPAKTKKKSIIRQSNLPKLSYIQSDQAHSINIILILLRRNKNRRNGGIHQ